MEMFNYNNVLFSWLSACSAMRTWAPNVYGGPLVDNNKTGRLPHSHSRCNNNQIMAFANHTGSSSAPGSPLIAKYLCDTSKYYRTPSEGCHLDSAILCVFKWFHGSLAVVEMYLSGKCLFNHVDCYYYLTFVLRIRHGFLFSQLRIILSIFKFAYTASWLAFI